MTQALEKNGFLSCDAISSTLIWWRVGHLVNRFRSTASIRHTTPYSRTPFKPSHNLRNPTPTTRATERTVPTDAATLTDHSNLRLA